MEFKRFEALIEKFPQVQIFSTEGADLDRVITHFLSQREKVSTMSENSAKDSTGSCPVLSAALY